MWAPDVIYNEALGKFRIQLQHVKSAEPGTVDHPEIAVFVVFYAGIDRVNFIDARILISGHAGA